MRQEAYSTAGISSLFQQEAKKVMHMKANGSYGLTPAKAEWC